MTFEKEKKKIKNLKKIKILFFSLEVHSGFPIRIYVSVVTQLNSSGSYHSTTKTDVCVTVNGNISRRNIYKSGYGAVLCTRGLFYYSMWYGEKGPKGQFTFPTVCLSH